MGAEGWEGGWVGEDLVEAEKEEGGLEAEMVLQEEVKDEVKNSLKALGMTVLVNLRASRCWTCVSVVAKPRSPVQKLLEILIHSRPRLKREGV